jgi:hypothetical protein
MSSPRAAAVRPPAAALASYSVMEKPVDFTIAAQRS